MRWKLKLEAKLSKEEAIKLSTFLTYSFFHQKRILILQDIDNLNNKCKCILKSLDKFRVNLVHDDLISYEGYLIMNALVEVISAADIFLKPDDMSSFGEIIKPPSNRDRLDELLNFYVYLWESKITYNQVLDFVEKYPEKHCCDQTILDASHAFMIFCSELFDINKF